MDWFETARYHAHPIEGQVFADAAPERTPLANRMLAVDGPPGAGIDAPHRHRTTGSVLGDWGAPVGPAVDGHARWVMVEHDINAHRGPLDLHGGSCPRALPGDPCP